MSNTKLQKQARRLCTHTIVFDDVTDVTVVIRGMQGRSTRAIAEELGITEAQAQYRVAKAQNSVGTRFRADYRSGNNAITRSMLASTARIAKRYVTGIVAPKFMKPVAPVEA